MRRSYVGRLFSTGALITSLILSLRASWRPDLEWYGCALLVAITVCVEASKFLCNRTLFISRGVRWWQYMFAGLWYIGCICASVYLMQDLLARKAGGQESQIRTVAANKVKTEAEVAGLKSAIEEARTAIVPGIRSAERLRDQLRERGLSKDEKAELHAELTKAEHNDQMAAKVTRLSGELSSLIKTTPERSQTSGDLHENIDVHESHERSERLRIMGYTSALLLELIILGGFWVDGIHNRGIEAPEPVPVVIHAATVAQTSMNATAFETFMRREWQTKRGKDGWLEGTQQGWGRAAGVSSGFVHTQLNAMIAAGKIEKRTQVGGAGKTRIKFLKSGELKIVRT